jgi:hypothetical protein
VENAFRLDMSGMIAEEIKQLIQAASAKGLREEAEQSLTIIDRRLRTGPLDFGELVRQSKFSNLLVHVASVYPVSIRFAIHEEKRVVILLKVQLVST